MSDETKTERDLEPPAPVGAPGVQPSASGPTAAVTALGTPRITNGRLDTGLKLLAQAGAAHHDGRALSAEMASDPELAAELQRLARENPEGSGPFRQKVGADLLPSAPASGRAELVSMAAAGDTARGLGPASPPASGGPKNAPQAATKSGPDDAESAAPAPNWPPYGAPEEKSDTQLEIDASKLHIPRTAFVASRAAKAAEAERAEKRRALVRGLAVALFAGVVVLLGYWIVLRKPRPDVGAAEQPPAAPATVQVATTAFPAATVPALPAVPPSAPPPSGAPPASALAAPSPTPPVKSASSPRRPPTPPQPPKPPVPSPPTTQVPPGPIYD